MMSIDNNCWLGFLQGTVCTDVKKADNCS